MAVYVEKEGPVTTVILSRPEVRNAVDRETAAELADIFRAFETEAVMGAGRFAKGAGRHGSFSNI